MHQEVVEIPKKGYDDDDHDDDDGKYHKTHDVDDNYSKSATDNVHSTHSNVHSSEDTTQEIRSLPKQSSSSTKKSKKKKKSPPKTPRPIYGVRVG